MSILKQEIANSIKKNGPTESAEPTATPTLQPIPEETVEPRLSFFDKLDIKLTQLQDHWRSCWKRYVAGSVLICATLALAVFAYQKFYKKTVAQKPAPQAPDAT
jgi:hypothetical protein